MHLFMSHVGSNYGSLFPNFYTRKLGFYIPINDPLLFINFSKIPHNRISYTKPDCWNLKFAIKTLRSMAYFISPSGREFDIII